MNTKNTIPLVFDPQVIKDSNTFMTNMEKTSEQASHLRQDLKKLKDLLKGISQANIIGSGPGSNSGAMEYIKGRAFADKQRVEQSRLLGSQNMQNLMTEKKALALSRDSLRIFQNQNKMSMARSLHLKTDYEALKKIKSTTQLQLGLEATKVRLGLEVAAGNTKQIQKAQKIVGLYDRRITQLKQETAEQKKLERLETRRAARLTASQRAEKARSESRERLFGDGGANLFGIQAGLGANYAIMNGIRSAMAGAGKFTAELDLAMRNLQAITVTTDGNMQGLRETLVGISEETKFTAVEVANMAVTLGQAGLSTDEIVESSRAITLLATATGTDLTTAVGVATSVIGVFNLQGSEMARVANVMTEAVNGSKLSLDKLALGLQYSGNIAAQSGIRVEELTSALGAMANAGIRSGSTLGTGMRQILIALQKPSKEFQETLSRLGITMSDIDVRSQGLYGALANLRDGGFSAGDAIQTMQVRAAAAYNALSSNLDQMVDLETAFQGTTAAAQANETQMKAFSNQLLVLKSVAGSAAAEGLAPLLALSTEMITGFGNLLKSFREYPEVLRSVTTSVVALGAAFAVWKIARLTVGLFKFMGVTKALKFATTALTSTQIIQGTVMTALTAKFKLNARWAGIAAASVSFLGKAMKIALGPIGLVLLAVGTVVGAFSALRRRTRRAAASLDSAQTSFDRAAGSADSMEQSISSLDDRIDGLLSRYDRLSSDNAMLDSEIEGIKEQFISMGLDITSVGDDVDTLIETLRGLRAELVEEYVARVRLEGAELVALRGETDVTRTRQVEAFNESSAVDATGRSAADSSDPTLMPEVYAQSGYDPDEVARQTSIIGNENSTADEVAYAVANLRVMKAEFDSALDGFGIILATAGDPLLAQLNETLALGQAIADTAGEQQNQALAALRLEQEAFDANAETRPVVRSITDGVGDLNVSTISRLQAAGAEAPENDAIARLGAMRAEADQIEAESELLKDQADWLLNQDIISAGKHQSLLQDFNTIAGNVTQQLGGLQEASDEVTGAIDDAVTDNLETEIDTAVGGIEDAATKGDARAALGRAADLHGDLRDQQIAQAQAEGLDVQVYALRLAEIERDYAAKLTDIGDTFTEIVKGFDSDELEAVTDALETEFDEVGKSIEEASTEEGATALFEKAAELASEIREKQIERAHQTIEGVRALDRELEKIDTAYVATINTLTGTHDDTVEDIDEKAVDDQTEAMKSQVELSQAVYDQTMDLANTTIDLAEQNRLLSRADGERQQLLDDTLALIGVEYADRGPHVLENKTDLAHIEDEGRTTNITNLRTRGPRKPRGSGSSDETDPIEEWVDATTAQVTAVNLGVAEAMFTPGEAVDKITGTVAEAQTKIEGITAQIEAMRSRVLSGTLTADEQERLNTLVEQHGRLSTFVLNQQKALVELKYEEGDIMGALRMQVQQFATENLDMGKTLMEGIGGALSSLTGSLKNFFKSWADGTKSGKEAFKDLALSVVSSIADMMAEMLAMYILQTALGFIMGTGPAASRGPSFAPPVRPVAAGGRIRGKAAGGRVDGNHPRDTQLHKLMDDEFVVRSSAARAIGFDNLEKMNAMGNNAVSQAPHRGVAAPKAAAKEKAVTNIYLVDERSQAGGIGPDDIIAVINDDIARGGTTKKLIKSVSSGAM